MVSPIKIKICDRNSLMGLSYEYKLVKVRQANGAVVIKNEKDVLKTDTILAYLPNDYIAPIQVKLLDINIVYAIAEVLRLIVNYGYDIPEKFAIVYEYIKTRAKAIFKGNISRPLTICYGRTQAKPPSIKIKDISGITLKEFSEYVIDRVCTEHDGMLISKAQIVTALDIFKEIGLFAGFKIKAAASGLAKVWSPFKTKVVAKVDIPVAIRTVYTTIVSKLIHKTNMEKAIEVYYAYPTNRSYKRIRNISGMTVGQITSETTIDGLIWRYGMVIFAAEAKYALAELVHEDEAVNRVSQNSLADRLLTVNYGVNSSNKNRLLLSMHGITQGVVKTKKKIEEIDDLTLKDIKNNNMTLDDILYKYS